MTYLVEWVDGNGDYQERAVSSVAELDATLDGIDVGGGPLVVGINDAAHLGEEIPFGVEIGLAHPHRSFVTYAGPPASGAAYDPTLPAWDEAIVFDYGGEPTDYQPTRTRVTPEQARAAAREYVATGGRPTRVRWISAVSGAAV